MWKCLGSPIPSPFDRLRTAPSPTRGEGGKFLSPILGEGLGERAITKMIRKINQSKEIS